MKLDKKTSHRKLKDLPGKLLTDITNLLKTGKLPSEIKKIEKEGLPSLHGSFAYDVDATPSQIAESNEKQENYVKDLISKQDKFSRKKAEERRRNASGDYLLYDDDVVKVKSQATGGTTRRRRRSEVGKYTIKSRKSRRSIRKKSRKSRRAIRKKSRKSRH